MEHVKKIRVSCHYYLRNIAKIRKYLSEDTSEIQYLRSLALNWIIVIPCCMDFPNTYYISYD